MALTADFPDLEAARDNARKVMAMRLGFASPFWLAFGAAASAGVAFWWATRWTREVNLEPLAFKEALAELPEPEPEIAAPVAEEPAVEEPVLEVAPVAEAPVEAIAEPVAEAPAEPIAEAEPYVAQIDDLTRLTGIGPKLAAALADRGITTFAQLAAWTEENATAFDAELSLKGRVARDAWVAQARRLASEA
jgi:predicted flap endonuclease-1-like 5' DNA nuclease